MYKISMNALAKTIALPTQELFFDRYLFLKSSEITLVFIIALSKRFPFRFKKPEFFKIGFLFFFMTLVSKGFDNLVSYTCPFILVLHGLLWF